MTTFILFFNDELVKTTQAENLAAATQLFALWLERKFENLVFAIGDYGSSFKLTGFIQKSAVKQHSFSAILNQEDVDFVELFEKKDFIFHLNNAADFSV